MTIRGLEGRKEGRKKERKKAGEARSSRFIDNKQTSCLSCPCMPCLYFLDCWSRAFGMTGNKCPSVTILKKMTHPQSFLKYPPRPFGTGGAVKVDRGSLFLVIVCSADFSFFPMPSLDTRVRFGSIARSIGRTTSTYITVRSTT